jgi:hypothetical protein
MLLLTLPIFAWFLEQEQRDLKRLIISVLDQLAEQNKLLKLNSEGRPISFRQVRRKPSVRRANGVNPNPGYDPVPSTAATRPGTGSIQK